MVSVWHVLARWNEIVVSSAPRVRVQQECRSTFTNMASYKNPILEHGKREDENIVPRPPQEEDDDELVSPRPSELPTLSAKTMGTLYNRLHPTSWNKGNHAKGGGRISKPVKPKISITNSARPWKYIPDNDLDVLFAPRVPKKKDTLDVRAPAGFGGSQFNRVGRGRRGRNIVEARAPEDHSVSFGGGMASTFSASAVFDDRLNDEISQTGLVNPGVMAGNSSLGNLLEPSGANRTVDVAHKRERTPTQMTKRGELLKRAQEFKTFMQIMEEHPLYDLPYGDSFLYLHSTNGSSYELDIIKHHDINPEDYFTLSYTGVTHFVGKSSDFTPLDQFEREHYLFSMISEIHFFHHYWEWKMFSVWRKTIRAIKMRKAKNHLKNNLFSLHPILGPSMVMVRGVILRVEHCRLYKINGEETYSLDAFCIEQTSQAESCTKNLSEMQQDLSDITYQACDQTLRRFLVDNNFHTEEDGEPESGNVGHAVIGEKSLTMANNSVLDGDDDAMDDASSRFVSFTERAAMRTQCRRLVQYIRLVDFHVYQTHLMLAKVSVEDLLRHIALFDGDLSEDFDAIDDGSLAEVEDLRITDVENDTVEDQASEAVNGKPPEDGEVADLALVEDRTEDTKIRPIFKVEMDFDTEHGGLLKFLPQSDMFKMRVEGIIFDGLKVVNGPPRLLEHDSFQLFVQPTIDEHGKFGEAADIEMMLLEEPVFTAMLDGIGERMASAFEDAEVNAQQLRPFLSVFMQNLSTIERLSLENYEDKTHSEITNLIDTHREQTVLFQTIPLFKQTGFILINIEDLKRAFTPSPLRCLEAIGKLLPQIAKKKNTILLEWVLRCHEIVAHNPYNPGEFVHLTKFMREFEMETDKMDDDYYFLTEYYRILSEYEIPISEEDSQAHVELVQTMGAFKDAISYSEEANKERLDRFSKELTRAIPKLREEVEVTRKRLEDERISHPESMPNQVLEYLDAVQETTGQLDAKSKEYLDYQNVLGLAAANWELIEELKEDLALKIKLWQTVGEWKQSSSTWISVPYNEIDINVVTKQMLTYRKICSQCEFGMPNNEVVPKLKAEVNDFYMTIPLITDLTNPAMTERHWSQIHSILEFQLYSTEAEPLETIMTLGQLMDRDIKRFAQELSDIASTASNEQGLEIMLEKLVKTWRKLEFEVLPYKDKKNVYILGGVDDIISALDDSLITISTLMGSRYVGPIKAQVEDWHIKLNKFQDTLDAWMDLQRSWAYLENIFSGADIAKQLPNEDRMFKIVDNFYKDLMKQCFSLPNCIETGTKHQLREKMLEHSKTLDKVQKALENFLEKKRNAFPRFFFLSNDELLEVLGQAKDPRNIQPHMGKCFDAVKSLEFGDQATGAVDINAMISLKGERIALGKNLKARGPVEEWLMDFEVDMQKTLTALVKEGVQSYGEYEREQWIRKCKGQVVATVTQIMWSRGCEKSLRAKNVKTSMTGWYEDNVKQLSTLTRLVRGILTSLERRIIVALCTVDVHARDIVHELLEANVQSTDDFKWQQQLRNYWLDDTNEFVVRQSTSNIPYGYEYMGCTSRLVITPLTDRCWMTITGSLHLKLGAAPAGPAGTGKTESSKDLAKALGIVCIVFNCSDQIDCIQTSKLFRGLAQQGAWTCLDEFNRIDIEVLSVVAQQLLVLRQGRLTGTGRVSFDGHDMPVKEMHVIITMNPGYAGRTELPDNLKVLFRPVSMMVPDFALISEIMLFAEGFDGATKLSKKLWDSYKLSSEQLSQQRHYDYGLRAVKSVLVMAGTAKRANPTMSEEAVLIKAMKDSNLPKFLANDLPLYHAILRDLFPGVNVPDNRNLELEDELRRQSSNFGLQCKSTFIHKIVQLYEMFSVRFGACIVGPAGSGKSSITKVLKESLTSLYDNGIVDVPTIKQTETFVMNPKAITMGELYGEYNLLSQEWTDGLASGILRNNIRLSNTTDILRWTVFDGPIDAVWIENMNTVLDDNCMLCLANGERIKLNWTMRMLFEVENLDEASPATVSRLGVIYVPPKAVGWKPLVQSWIDKMFPNDVVDSEGEPLFASVREQLNLRFNTLVQECLDFRRKQCSEPVVTSDFNGVHSLLSIMESIIKWDGGERMGGKNGGIDWSKKPTVARKEMIDKIFSFSLLWSVGGSVCSNDREKFEVFLGDLYEQNQCEELSLGSGRDSFYDVFFNSVGKQKGTFQKWIDILQTFSYDANMPYFDLVVPTIDTTRYSYFAETLIRNKQGVFFTGTTGTGKTAILSNVLGQMSKTSEDDDENHFSSAYMTINFSAQTSSLITQTTIENGLERKKKSLLGPPRVNKIMTIFVDDVNMPEVEEYGAQAPIELLRQLIDTNGMYEREEWMWRDIADTIVCTAAAPPGGGRSVVTARFVRHFNVFCVPDSSEVTMNKIFSSIIDNFMEAFDFPFEVKSLSSGLVSATVELYSKICAELLPTPAKIHYQFNLRDVSKVFQGILMIKSRQCKESVTMGHLWLHEASRVFADRLVNETDNQWFRENSVDMMKRHLGGAAPAAGWEVDKLFGEEPVLFGFYMRAGVVPAIYEEAPELSKVKKIFNDFLSEYNDPSNKNESMDLVFFRAAIEHVSRIARILKQPRGNAMLIGNGGSGKQSLTKLGCIVSGAVFTQITLTQTFGITEFRESIKEMMETAGVKRTPVAFTLTDSQIVTERFLEDVSSILNSGEIPNLWASDEWERIVVSMSPVCKDLGIAETRANCIKTFTMLVRENLHIILCMSPVGDDLRRRCLQFPSLINCCTIDWFTKWPREGLQTVAQRFYGKMGLPDDIYDKLVNASVELHCIVDEGAAQFYQETRRSVYITPCSYLDLLNLYGDILKVKEHEVQNRIETLATGVKKLEETNETVGNLQVELKELQPVLKTKAAEAEELLKVVAVEKEEAEEMRIKVEAEEKIVSAQAAEVKIIADDAQADLDRALPALAGAVKALKALDKKDIQEIKSFTNPPKQVAFVMEAVCILLGHKPAWDAAKKVLGMMDFLSQLQNYDKDNIRADILKKIAKYVIHEDMQVELVGKISLAAKSLCMWVHAINTYSIVAKEVEPKKKRLAEMNAKLDAANAVLAEKKAASDAVAAKVRSLEELCDKTMKEKKQLEEDTKLTRDRLLRATKLTSGLAEEQVRWQADKEDLIRKVPNMYGDMFLSAAYVAYLGPFTGVYRDRLLSLWVEQVSKYQIPNSGDDVEVEADAIHDADRLADEKAKILTKGVMQQLIDRAASRGGKNSVKMAFQALDVNGDGNIDMDEFRSGLQRLEVQLNDADLERIFNYIDADKSGTLEMEEFDDILKDYKSSFSLSNTQGNPVRILDWQINGLPSDNVSTENAIMVTQSKRYSLLIDPQGQANRWIRNIEAKSGIECVKNNDLKLARKVENCLRMGTPLMVEDMGETLPPAIGPVLAKPDWKVLRKPPLVRMGDQEIEYHRDFRLYMTTKMPNPHYTPAICIKVLIINFTVTNAGLQEQLLGDVVRNERPELEKKKRQLVMGMSEDKKQLKDLEAKILFTLSTATGNILDNQQLIATLADSKTKSALIQKRVIDSEKAEQEINAARSDYVPVAARGSILYFVIASLATIDPMYQFSLDYFQRIFRLCVQDATKSTDLDVRLANLINYQTEVIFENICRGLFERHKLILSLIICMRIVMANNLVSDEEYDIFMKGAGVMNRDIQPPNPDTDSLSPLQWDLVCKLEERIPAFQGFVEELSNNLENWKEWMGKKQPYQEPLPKGPFSDTLSEMQRVLLIRVFRDDKVTASITEFIKKQLGSQFTSPPTSSMAQIEGDMDCKTPCVFVLSPGSDPTNILLQYAKVRNYLERLHVISLGQGQGPKAKALIDRCSESGDWVLLQNCHLAKSWMPELERIVSAMAEGKTAKDPDFRLFLTSMPTTYFPVTVLQTSLKMTNEAPEGMKNNMARSFKQVVPSDEENVPTGSNFETCKKSEAYKKLLFSLVFFHSIVQERRKFGSLGWNIRYEFNDSDLETSISVLRLFLDEQNSIPWDALNYVTGNINYGGRVTDDWDRRTLMCIMRKYYNPSVLGDKYKLVESSNTYYVPADGSFASYEEFIQTFPSDDEPGVFGMHSNAALTFQKKQTTSLLSTVLMVEAVGIGGGGGDKDQIVTDMVTTIESALPGNLLPEDAGSGVFYVDEETQLMSSLDTVLQQEMAKFNKLLNRMRWTLTEIQRAIKGLSVMSVDLELMYKSFVLNKVPALWEVVAYPSLQPLASWVIDLHSRMGFMSSWLTKGTPAVFPLPALFFPQGFLTGVLQTHARKYLIAINSLQFTFKVVGSSAEQPLAENEDDAEKSNPERDGVLVSGLWMEGMKWNSEVETIDDPNPGEMFSLLPVIHFLPAANVKPDLKDYRCPVYKISTRRGQLSTTGISTNYVTCMTLPSGKDQDYWIQRGAACLCNLDD